MGYIHVPLKRLIPELCDEGEDLLKVYSDTRQLLKVEVKNSFIMLAIFKKNY